MRILILGADGFIGRHIAVHFRTKGDHVIASARRVSRLSRMGFDTLRCDLASPEASTPAFWRENLRDVDAVVYAAGLLTGSEARFQAVHVTALQALLQTRPQTCPALFLSAVGIDEIDTPFARYRRDSERICREEDAIILRAGLVLGDTSYGGSSLARALAALPLITPQIGDGQQAFNPIHAADLAQSIDDLLSRAQPGQYEIGGTETVTQKDMLTAYRSWLGLGRSVALPLPRWLARGIGWVGDRMRLGPISSTAVDQLDAGVCATVILPENSPPARGFTQFLNARPAGTQDLWHARLYLLRPLLRLTLAFLWLFSAGLGLFLTPETFLPLLPGAPWPDGISVLMARLGGVVDLALGLALLRGWRPQLIAAAQFAMVATYTLAFTFLVPALWLLPLGGLLKNLPILVLIAISAILEDER
ncbi:DoxX-like family protein [uncultured Celeribacter sp.]|uniref:DoxX-like family protein n=1 Tax=uncultured Celeribacter sp. TaxID=1303376 RepID=UPI002AA7A8FD|nr:DoxX-like family protein [uncultured Celeribacter sp.]